MVAFHEHQLRVDQGGREALCSATQRCDGSQGYDVGPGGPARKAGQGAWASAGLDCDMTAHLLPLVSEDLEAQLVLLRDEVKAQMGFVGF